jgi:hypothetical protein
MSDQGPTDPALAAAHATSLPRTRGRAQAGLTTDPVPEGKVIDSSPKHHFTVLPGKHFGAPKPAVGGPVPEDTRMRELEKMHPEAKGHQHRLNDVQAGMDFQGAATTSNKKMDSRHTGSDFPKTKKNKHLNSRARSELKHKKKKNKTLQSSK